MKKEEKIAILQEIIRIKSVNGNEGEVAAYLNKLLGIWMSGRRGMNRLGPMRPLQQKSMGIVCTDVVLQI